MTTTVIGYAQTAASKSRQETELTVHIAGSGMAFEQLYALHASAIYRVTLSITRDPSDAEDAMQDAFLRAYLNLDKFRNESPFYSWLVRIAINSSLELLRKRRRREFLLEDYSDPESDVVTIEVADSRPNPEGSFSLKQTHIRLERSLKVLPKRLRVVAELRILQEQSIHEISAILGISQNAAKSRLHRARKRIASAKWLKHHLRQQST